MFCEQQWGNNNFATFAFLSSCLNDSRVLSWEDFGWVHVQISVQMQGMHFIIKRSSRGILCKARVDCTVFNFVLQRVPWSHESIHTIPYSSGAWTVPPELAERERTQDADQWAGKVSTKWVDETWRMCTLWTRTSSAWRMEGEEICRLYFCYMYIRNSHSVWGHTLTAWSLNSSNTGQQRQDRAISFDVYTT